MFGFHKEYKYVDVRRDFLQLVSIEVEKNQEMFRCSVPNWPIDQWQIR